MEWRFWKIFHNIERENGKHLNPSISQFEKWFTCTCGCILDLSWNYIGSTKRRWDDILHDNAYGSKHTLQELKSIAQVAYTDLQ